MQAKTMVVDSKNASGIIATLELAEVALNRALELIEDDQRNLEEGDYVAGLDYAIEKISSKISDISRARSGRDDRLRR